MSDKPTPDSRGTWQYECTSCGNQIDEDHDYCRECDQRGGEWVLIAADGEPVDTNNYGIETFEELIKATELLFKHFDECASQPAMETICDKHGNSGGRLMRSGCRVAMGLLEKVVRRAKQDRAEYVCGGCGRRVPIDEPHEQMCDANED